MHLTLYIEAASIDIEEIVRKLTSTTLKQEGLDNLQEALNLGYSTASFLGYWDKIF